MDRSVTLLVVCLMLAAACSPAQPPPTAAPVLHVEDLAGVWVRKAGEYFLEFNLAGTFRAGRTLAGLRQHPVIEGEFWFEEGHLFIRDTFGDALVYDRCVGEPAGEYVVAHTPEDELVLVAVDEPCGGRAATLTTQAFDWVDS